MGQKVIQGTYKGGSHSSGHSHVSGHSSGGVVIRNGRKVGSTKAPQKRRSTATNRARASQGFKPKAEASRVGLVQQVTTRRGIRTVAAQIVTSARRRILQVSAEDE